LAALFTKSLSSLLALKNVTRLAGTSTPAPVICRPGRRMRCHVACPERLGSSPLIAFFDTIVSLEELASRFMNWRQLMSLSRRQLLLLPKKEDNPQHDSGKANSASRIQRERLSHGKTLARKVLASEHPMLYDHAGRPIPSDSELWRTADTEWRRKADHVVLA